MPRGPTHHSAHHPVARQRPATQAADAVFSFHLQRWSGPQRAKTPQVNAEAVIALSPRSSLLCPRSPCEESRLKMICRNAGLRGLRSGVNGQTRVLDSVFEISSLLPPNPSTSLSDLFFPSAYPYLQRPLQRQRVFFLYGASPSFYLPAVIHSVHLP
jgi:hypothetical protein